MSLLLPKSAFLDIPKTEGAWVAACLRNMSLTYGAGMPHLTARKLQELAGTRPIFTFIRNPVTWYQNRWADKLSQMQLKKTPLPYRTKLERKNFCTWLRGVLESKPSYVTKLYKRYLGSKFDKVDMIGKTEHLKDDLARCLAVYGERFSWEYIEDTPPVNEEIAGDKRYTRKLLLAVLENEKQVMQKFDYPINPAAYEDILK